MGSYQLNETNVNVLYTCRVL